MNKYRERVVEMGGRFVYSRSGRQPVAVSESEICDVEQQLGHSLPADYREFLRDYGGFKFFAGFAINPRRPEDPEAAAVGVFYGIMPSDQYDLLLNYSETRYDLPAELLPIVQGNTGKTCLALAGEHQGCIFYWDQIADSGDTGFDNVHLVAKSFDEFVWLWQRG